MKRLAERLMNHQFWIERATERKDIENVIQSLRSRRNSDLILQVDYPITSVRPPGSMGLTIPSFLEMTFYRNDRTFCAPGTLTYPHPLDADCASTKPTAVLPECWQLKGFDLAPISLGKVTATTILKMLFRSCFRFWIIIRGAAILQLIRNVFGAPS
jgi:hypothetical protein